MSSKQTKPRLLCLHGQGSNEHVTKAQIRNLGLDRYFEVTNLNAPLRYTAKDVDQTVRSLCPNGPFYSWIHRERDQLPNLVASLQYVLTHIRNRGPYDAVYGFSHGAGIAALLSCPKIREQLGEPPGHNAPWKFLFAACATFPLSKQDIMRHFDLDDAAMQLSIPIAHMIGIEDPFKSKSEGFLETVEGNQHTDLSLISYFEGGHEISSETKNLKKIATAAIEWYSKHCPQDLKLAASPAAFLPAVTDEMNRLALQLPETSSMGGNIGQYHLTRNETTTHRETTLGMLLKRDELQNQIAFRSPDRDPITFGALRTFVENEGNLSALGCRKGDKVAYMVPFGVVGAAAFITIATQCQAIPLDPESTDENLRDALRQMKPDVFILFDHLGEDECERIEYIVWELGIRIIEASGRKSPDVPFVFDRRNDDRSSTESKFIENDDDDNCLLLRTSGTTSQPKVCNSR